MTADAPDLVTLLYRADWTSLSLAADVSVTSDHGLAELRAEKGSGRGSGRPARSTADAWEVATDRQGAEVSRSTLLIAPGGRYRQQSDGFRRGCDGDRSWRVRGGDPDASVAESPVTSWSLETLLRPSWLLTGFTLDIGGPVTACGRPALRVVATPRRGIRGARGPRRPPVDLVEVIVDAELGILLRHEEIIDGQPLSVTELTNLSLNPAGAEDDAQFQPPSGWDGGTEEAEPPAPRAFGSGSGSGSGSGWGPARIAAHLAANRLGARVKSSSPDPFAQATREEPEAAMPADEPMAPDSLVASPVSDEIVHLLYGSQGRWAPGIAATLHQWQDLSAMLLGFPGQFRRVGLGGSGVLGGFFESMGQQIPNLQIHTASDLRIGGPERYRVDVVAGAGKGTVMTTVCDGEQCWKIYFDRVTVGPAAPLAGEIADLFDASWLLTARLTGGIETTVAGRRGYRLAVAPENPRRRKPLAPNEVVVDAESGCLLRLISRTDTGSGSGADTGAGSRVVTWYELRDVTSYAGAADDFRPDIPDGTRVDAEDDDAPPGPFNLGTSTAGVYAREAVREARSAVEGFLGFFRGGAGG